VNSFQPAQAQNALVVLMPLVVATLGWAGIRVFSGIWPIVHPFCGFTFSFGVQEFVVAILYIFRKIFSSPLSNI